jgi:hypothetical protein
MLVKILVEKPKGRDHLENVYVGARIVLKWALHETESEAQDMVK